MPGVELGWPGTALPVECPTGFLHPSLARGRRPSQHLTPNGQVQQVVPPGGLVRLFVPPGFDSFRPGLTPRSIWRDMMKSAGMIASR